MAKDVKLKPCPFCGSKVDVVVGISGLTMMYCPFCLATVSFGKQEKENETIKAWNRRAKSL